MDYAEIESSAKQAKTRRELWQINERVETLFCQGKLEMTDENWINYTKLLAELSPSLPV